MSQLFLFKQVGPKSLKVPNVRGHLLVVVNKYARLIQKDYADFVGTWNHKVTFVTYRNFAGGDVSVRIYTIDKVFGYLDRGTTVRFATMTRGFIPKTAPRRVQSQAGKGGVMFVSRKFPKPGIQARNITLTIRQRHEENFKNDVRRAIVKGIAARMMKGKS